MRKNLYTKTIDSFSISQSTVSKTLRTLNTKKAHKKSPYAVKVAVVACTAIIVAVGGTLTDVHFSQKNTNSFILTANAKQMNTLTYIYLGKLSGNRSSAVTEIDTQTQKWLYMNIERIVDFPVIANGENIVKTNFRFNGNGYFLLNDHAEISDKESVASKSSWQGNPDHYPYTEDEENYPEKVYSYSLPPTIKADQQVKLVLYVQDEKGKYCQKADTLRQYDEQGKVGNTSTKYFNQWFWEMFKEYSNYYSVDVTVTYKDGSIDTQKIVFDVVKYDKTGCLSENDDNIKNENLNLTIKAKLSE